MGSNAVIKGLNFESNRNFTLISKKSPCYCRFSCHSEPFIVLKKGSLGRLFLDFISLNPYLSAIKGIPVLILFQSDKTGPRWVLKLNLGRNEL